MSKFFVLNLCLLALAAIFIAPAYAADMAMDAVAEKVEDSTVSPIADMAMIDEEMKTSTERPPVMESPKQEEKPNSQRHTVADFIIHPLIAFKPRNPDEDIAFAAGKQATTNNSTAPLTLFGYTVGQGLGSSVSNWAGQVSNWLNDRVQIPGLVDSPIRDPSSTSTTTTTTTPRPDVVVRVQHKASTRRPLIAINNRKRPNRPNFVSEENDDDEDEDDDNENGSNSVEENENEDSSESDNNEETNNNNNNSGEEEEEEDDESNNVVNNKDEEDENLESEGEENHSQRPNNRRRPLRNQNNIRNGNNQRRRVRPQQQQKRRRGNNRRKPQNSNQRRRPVASNDDSEEQSYDDDENDNDGNDHFYYGARPSTKRSQSNPNFIQRGQQQLLNQIRQFTRGQTPAEVGNAIRRAQQNNGNNRRRQQATLYVNRNGQPVYMAPELLPQQYSQQVYSQPVVHNPMQPSVFPQPPLTVPLKVKGQPTQYITIPWAQLGISPPNNLVSITEGIQGQPLILNIPQSAINAMQMQAQSVSRPKKRKNRPQLITADAVPLLADASLMDIFKPIQLPASRATINKKTSETVTSGNATPVMMNSMNPTSTKTSSMMLQQRIRAGTVVEKAPDMMDTMKQTTETETKPVDDMKTDTQRAIGEKEYIIIGQDDEPGLTRNVQPVYGEARYVRLGGNSQFYDVVPRRRFGVRRGGRELTQPEEVPEPSAEKTETQIPVKVITEPETVATVPSMVPAITVNSEHSEIAENTESAKVEEFKMEEMNEKPIPKESTQQMPEMMAT